MESLGLGDFLVFKNMGPNQDPVSIYTILSEMKRECDAWKKEAKALEEKLSSSNQQLEKEH